MSGSDFDFEFDVGFFDYVERNEYEDIPRPHHPSDVWDTPLFELEEEV